MPKPPLALRRFGHGDSLLFMDRDARASASSPARKSVNESKLSLEHYGKSWLVLITISRDRSEVRRVLLIVAANNATVRQSLARRRLCRGSRHVNASQELRRQIQQGRAEDNRELGATSWCAKIDSSLQIFSSSCSEIEIGKRESRRAIFVHNP